LLDELLELELDDEDEDDELDDELEWELEYDFLVLWYDLEDELEDELELFEVCDEADIDEFELCALLWMPLLCELCLSLALKLFESLLLDDRCLELDRWRCLRTQIFRSFSFSRRSKSDEADEDAEDEWVDLCWRANCLCFWRLELALRFARLAEWDDELLEILRLREAEEAWWFALLLRENPVRFFDIDALLLLWLLPWCRPPP